MIGEGKAGPADGRADESRLGEREAQVLEELAAHNSSQVAFQGLKRKLELHQEILARTLRRLERDGLVRKESSGYALTPVGARSLRGRLTGSGPIPATTILDAILPPHLDAKVVASQLSGRWFRGLRWYGSSAEEDATVLTWLTEPGNRPVRLRIGGGRLKLEADASLEGPSGSFGAARSVLAAIAEVYGLDSGLHSGVVAFGETHQGMAG
jgi:hypothetical protein